MGQEPIEMAHCAFCGRMTKAGDGRRWIDIESAARRVVCSEACETKLRLRDAEHVVVTLDTTDGGDDRRSPPSDLDHTFDDKSNVRGDPSCPTIKLYPTGVYFTPFQPNPEHLDIRCIAHGLAGTNRFNGHTRTLMNVAHHSIVVSVRVQATREPLTSRELLVKEIREGRAPSESARGVLSPFQYGQALRVLKRPLSGLLHDAPEGVDGFGDITGPVKRHPSFKELIERVEFDIAGAIAIQHNLPLGFASDPIVKAADAWAYHWENRDLRRIDPPPGVVLPPETLLPLNRDDARVAFLARYVELTGEIDSVIDWPEREVTWWDIDRWSHYSEDLLRIVSVV